MFNIIWRINSFRSSPTRRINPSQHIHRKLIKVCPSHQSNLILIHKPTDVRLIVPEEVVMQPGLFIVILILKSERMIRILINPLIFFQTTPSGVFAVPQEVAVLISHLTRDTDLVAVEVVGLLASFTVFGCPEVDLCQEFVAVGIGVDTGISAVRVDFLQQMADVPNESSFLFEAV